MGFLDLIKSWKDKQLERRQDFKDAEEQLKIQRLLEQRGKSSNERELERFIKEGYAIAFTSTARVVDVPKFVNEKNDFETLINYVKHCDAYIGADNGVMHIASGFDKPCFVEHSKIFLEILYQPF